MSLIVYSATLSVALDGSQEYLTIQSAIDASAHGDLVLVYPGRYYENILFDGKNITLASLEFTTGDIGFKYTTIIDGNLSGAVIQVRNGESNVLIRGFTITRGTGVYSPSYDVYVGGGINVAGMSGQRNLNITNCIFTGNNADYGGGLWISACNVYLSGVSIYNNRATYAGGYYYSGSFTISYNHVYDQQNRCSIYNNYAAFGSDMYYYLVNSVQVVVDTFTVAEPSNFYASAITAGSSITNPYTFDILNHTHTEVNHDIYVAPWGDDGNSGLSPFEPMQSIFMAVYKVASDSLNPKTVHLANGYYSTTANNQMIPISIKDHVRLFGQSRENTIINCEDRNFCMLPSSGKNHMLKSMTITNPRCVLACSMSAGVEIEDISVRSSIASSGSFMFVFGISVSNLRISKVSINNIIADEIKVVYAIPILDSILIDDVSIKDCYANTKTMLLGIDAMGSVTINNFHASNNTSASSDEFAFNSLMQIAPIPSAQYLRMEITNSVFTNNYQGRYQHMANIRALNDTVFISNCTFADNSGGAQVLAVQGTSVLSNNIFWNPAIPTEVLVPYYSGINSNSTFSNNNIRNGISGVVNSSAQNPMIWEDNNHSFDPLFAMTGNHPYSLSAESPLIDLGMDGEGAPDYGDFDAGGNERIWDGDGDGIARIDIGAYEYQPIFAPVNLEASVYGNEVFLLWEHSGNSRRGAAKPAMDENIKKSAAKSSTLIPDPDRESRRSYQNPHQQSHGNRAHIGYRIYRNGMPYTDILDPEIMYFEDRITQSDTLTYYVKALYGDVESPASNEVTVYVEVVSNSDESMPGIAFLQVSPNPFREMAVIKIGIKEPGLSRLEVYNLKGQKVKTIMHENLAKGEHYFCWNGDDDSGRNVSSGVYFLRQSVNGRAVHSRRVLLLK